LDTADAAIQQTEVLIAKLKQMKAGLLHDLLTRGIDEQGQLRDPIAHPEQFKDSPNGWLPLQWAVYTVGDVFDLQLGKMLSKSAKTGLRSYPYLANRNVQWDRVDVSDVELMDFSEFEREKFSLTPGDLLVCEGGDVGRTAIWQGEMDNCYFQKAIHRLRPVGGRVLPE
jgi:type I restriction enzyme S subunit